MEIERAPLDRIAAAVASAVAYMRYANVSVTEAVDVVCDYDGIADDGDRRIIRGAVVRRLEREMVDAVQAAGGER